MSKILIFFGFFTFIFDFCTNPRCFPLNFRQQQHGYFIFFVYFRQLAKKEQIQPVDFQTHFFVFLQIFLEIGKNLC